MAARVRKGGWISALMGDCRAVGAVEFAIIAPVLLLAYMGGVELTVGLTLDRKVKHFAATVSDLVSQNGAITAGEIDDILAIASPFLQPYRAGTFGSVVSLLKIDPAGQVSVVWSRAQGTMEAIQPGTSFTLPQEIVHLRDTTLVRAESAYRYVPAGGYGIQTPFVLKGVSFTSPRIGGAVNCVDCF